MGSFLAKTLFNVRYQQTNQSTSRDSFLDIELTTIQGDKQQMKDYVTKNKLTIVVVVASKCCFAHKVYVELVNVYQEYKNQGLEIVAFPTDQFLSLEYANDEQIIDFSQNKLGVSFPMMKKCKVNGPEAHNVFKYLRRNTKEFLNKETGKIKNIPWHWAPIDTISNITIYQMP